MWVFRILRKLVERKPAPHVDALYLVPAIRDRRELADLAARVNCYLAGIEQTLHVDTPEMDVGPEDAPYMEPALVHDPDWNCASPSGKSGLIIHRLTAGTALKALVSRRRPTLAVTDFHFLAEREWFFLRDRLGPKAVPGPDESFRRVTAAAGPSNTAFILATGPSAGDVDVASVDAEVRITCNSAVRDLDRLKAFRPTFIVFADPVFHFGPSAYAAAFRKDLRRAIEETDALLVTSNHYATSLLATHREFADRIAVMPLLKGEQWIWPTAERPFARATGNVLTNLMLPLACATSSEILVAGCDGRKSAERYFWKHNSSMQYSDELMQTAFAAHPAFFRDRDYADYYERHCRDLEEFFQVAEAAGKVVRGVTRSRIPALLRRGAPQFAHFEELEGM